MASYSNLQEQPEASDILPNQGGQRLSIPNMEQRRKSSYGIYNRIVLCAVDPNPHSREAFDWFLRNIWRSDDLIVLAYCPETPNFPTISFKKGFTPPVDLWREILEEMNMKTRKLEEEYEGICVEKKGPIIRARAHETIVLAPLYFKAERKRIAGGKAKEWLIMFHQLRYKVRWEAYKNPGEGICKIADEEKAELIIMGSRGLGMLKRAFMGSVSEYIIRNSGLPCLVIPSGKMI